VRAVVLAVKWSKNHATGTPSITGDPSNKSVKVSTYLEVAGNSTVLFVGLATRQHCTPLQNIRILATLYSCQSVRSSQLTVSSTEEVVAYEVTWLER